MANVDINTSAAETLSQDLKYPLPLSVGNLVNSIRTIQINSDKNSYESQGEIISIELSSTDSFLDCLRSYICFDASITGTNKTTTRLTGCVTRLFSRVRVITSTGLVLSDIDRFDILSEILLKNIPTDYKNEVLAMSNIRSSPVDLSTPERFYMPLFSVGFFSIKKLLPLHLMPAIRIELTVNNANKCLEFKDAKDSSDIKIEKVKLNASLINMKDIVNASTRSILDKNNKIMIPYFDYAHSQFAITSADVASYDLRKSASDIRSVYAIIRPASTKTTSEYASVPGVNVNHVSLKMANHNFPTESPLTDPVSQYIEFRKSFNQFQHIIHPSVPYAKDSNNEHVIGVDLEILGNSFGSGVSTMSGNFLTLNVGCSDGKPTDSPNMNVFLLYSRILEILPNRVVGVQE
jgi:hypothetical protein